jgi:hypothetical protein
MTRRTRCYLIAKRARLLVPQERERAWTALTERLEELGGFEGPIPKFKHLIGAIRSATIQARKEANADTNATRAL